MIVTKKAQELSAPAVLGNNQIVESFSLYKNIGSKGAVVFFYPKDFTFVCPSEIIAFDKRYKDFKERGIEVIGVSCDNEFSHFAWKNTAIENGGIGNVQFPLVADLKKSGRVPLMCFLTKQSHFAARFCLTKTAPCATLSSTTCRLGATLTR